MSTHYTLNFFLGCYLVVPLLRREGESCFIVYPLRGSQLPQLLIEVNLERSTWQLLYALYTDRVEAGSHGDDEDMIMDIMVGQSNVLF